MKKADVFPSKYLKCADLNGKPITVTIDRVTFETLKSPDGKEQNKNVLYFRGGKKASAAQYDELGCLRRDLRRGHRGLAGTSNRAPTGQDQMAGKTVDCIRIRPPAQRELPKQKPPAAEPPPVNDMNDVIPW